MKNEFAAACPALTASQHRWDRVLLGLCFIRCFYANQLSCVRYYCQDYRIKRAWHESLGRQ